MPLCNVMLPAWLLYDRTVPAEEKSVIGCIRSFANRETRTARPGQRRIHRETGISLKTVNRCIARLSARGAFSTITRGRGRATSRYTIAEAWWWADPADKGRAPPMLALPKTLKHRQKTASVHPLGLTKGEASKGREESELTPTSTLDAARARTAEGREGDQQNREVPAEARCARQDGIEATAKPVAPSSPPQPARSPRPLPSLEQILAEARRVPEPPPGPQLRLLKRCRMLANLRATQWQRHGANEAAIAAEGALIERLGACLTRWNARSREDREAFNALVEAGATRRLGRRRTEAEYGRAPDTGLARIMAAAGWYHGGGRPAS